MPKEAVNGLKLEDWQKNVLMYIRKYPDKIYIDRLRDILNKYQINVSSEGEVLELFKTDEGVPLLAQDEISGGIYTIPGMREKYDYILKKSSNTYKYNKWLYINEKIIYIDNEKRIDLADIQKIKSIDLKKLFKLNNLFDCKKIFVTLNEFDVVKNFTFDNLIRLCNKYFSKDILKEKYKIEILAEDVIFVGNTVIGFENKQFCTYLQKISICGDFSRAIFLESVKMANMQVVFEKITSKSLINENNIVFNFRSARFLKQFELSDVKFLGMRGDYAISFEDARLDLGFRFLSVNFGVLNVKCFQTVIGDYITLCKEKLNTKGLNLKVEIINCQFHRDSLLDCTDMEMNNCQFILSNISPLPNALLKFAPVMLFVDEEITRACPDTFLKIENCDIYSVMFIGNVRELSFKNTKNFSRIIEMKNWAKVSDCDKYKYVYSMRGLLKNKINSNLLAAVYNRFGTENEKGDTEFALNVQKAKDFVMLKENFNKNGEYDYEDMALILYMEYKSYLDGQLKGKGHKDFINSGIYKILNICGGYGTKPLRVLVSIAFMIITFAIVYYNMFFCTSSNIIFDNFPGSCDMVKALLFSMRNVVPYFAQFKLNNLIVVIISVFESAVGTFLVGYFSVAVVRKTLR